MMINKCLTVLRIISKQYRMIRLMIIIININVRRKRRLMNIKSDYQTGEKKGYFHIPVSSFKSFSRVFFVLWSGITNKGRATIFSSPGNPFKSNTDVFVVLSLHPIQYGKKRVQQKKEQFFKRENPFLSSSHHLFFDLGLDQFLFSYHFTFNGVD